MSKKDKEIKQMEKILKPIRDDKAMELFNKHEYELNPLELKELDDNMCPRWKLWNEPASDGRVLEVSNIGTVRYADTKEPVKRFYTEGDHYPFINVMNKYQKRIPRTIHRMVAILFVSNPDPVNKTQVNHIDGCKNHPWAGNLEWVTDQENKQHAVRTGLISVGEDCSWSIYTNEQICQVCQLLQDESWLTVEEISERTGVRQDMIYNIYKRVSWKHISKDYEFPARRSIVRHTEDQVKIVCKMLCEHPEMTFEDISEKTGVTRSTVAHVYRREDWTDISSKYDFPPREVKLVGKGEDHWNNNFSEEKIREVCQMLCEQPDWTYEKISQETGVTTSVINGVYNHQYWVDVSKDYNFPPRETTSKYTTDQIKHVCQLLQDHPEMKYDEIGELVGMDSIAVGTIYRGESWKDIVKDYTFDKRSTGMKVGQKQHRLTADEVEKVCCLLDKSLEDSSYSFKKISELSGVNVGMITQISRGKTWVNVAKKHPFYKKKFG